VTKQLVVLRLSLSLALPALVPLSNVLTQLDVSTLQPHALTLPTNAISQSATLTQAYALPPKHTNNVLVTILALLVVLASLVNVPLAKSISVAKTLPSLAVSLPHHQHLHRLLESHQHQHQPLHQHQHPKSLVLHLVLMMFVTLVPAWKAQQLVKLLQLIVPSLLDLSMTNALHRLVVMPPNPLDPNVQLNTTTVAPTLILLVPE